MTSEKTAELKKQAAVRAVEFVNDGMIVGLGTGSTVAFALDEIARRIKEGELSNIHGIPTSIQTKERASELQIPLTTLNKHPRIDITIDGADEVDDNLNLIKGGGGALLHEKIIEQATKHFIVIVDESKISTFLGEKFYLPVEVIKGAVRTETLYLEKLDAEVSQRMLENGEPYLTDENNYILKAKFERIEDPHRMNLLLNNRAGIVEHGLFVAMAEKVVVAGEKGVYIKERR